MPKSHITVRVSRAELEAVRRLPGETDSARIRYLIHAIDRLDSADREIAEIRAVRVEIRRTQRLVAECFHWHARAFESPEGSIEKLRAITDRCKHETE